MSDHSHTVTLEEWTNAACGAVVDAVRDGSEERKAAVARSIAEVEDQLPAELDDMTAFLQALQQLLAGHPPTEAGSQLSEWYAQVFHRVIETINEPSHGHDHAHVDHDHHPHPEPKGRRMGLDEVLEQIVQDTIKVMHRDNREERARMAQGLELLRVQATQAMEWPAFAEFLQAIQSLLRDEAGEHPAFEPPFDQAWARISGQLSMNREP